MEGVWGMQWVNVERKMKSVDGKGSLEGQILFLSKPRGVCSALGRDVSPVGDRAELWTAAGEAGAVPRVTELVPCSRCCGMCWATATAKNVEAKPDSFHAGFICTSSSHPLDSWEAFLRDAWENSPGKCQIPPERHFPLAVKETWKGLESGKTTQSPEGWVFSLFQ